MESKYTPGPWVAGPPATGMDPNIHRYIHAGGQLVARASAGYSPTLRLADQLDANARLIAAAPDLYEALRAAEKALVVAFRSNVDRDLYDSDADYEAAIGAHKVIGPARAALQKAGTP